MHNKSFKRAKPKATGAKRKDKARFGTNPKIELNILNRYVKLNFLVPL